MVYTWVSGLRALKGLSDPIKLDLPIFHPITVLFPLMTGDEYIALKADIEANGQRVPIWTYHGKIIDGRYRACRELGIKSHTQEWDGKGSLLQVLVGLNLLHHHYRKSQRAFIALDLVPLFAEEAHARQVAGLKRGNQPPVAQKIEQRDVGRAAGQAAKAVGISPPYVYHASRIAEQAPASVPPIRAGTLTISPPYRFLAFVKTPRWPTARLPNGWRPHGKQARRRYHLRS